MASPTACRSVLDYDSEESLRQALLGVDLAATTTDDEASRSMTSEDAYSRDLDWVLPAYDPETTNVQSMREELKRLQILKSYAILDTDREKVFERITGLASRLFNVPIALVSLVDLGRQWFMSNRGLGDVRETPRNFAFCAHAIMLKQSVLVVPDASKDFRFKNNPLVTGPPNIRFYAGAPLICAEGYKLGTLCIISEEVRPQGLSQDEQETLQELAELVVDAMTHRRKDLLRAETPAQLIAYTAHDIMTPLTGVQLSLSLLKDDEEVARKLNPHHMELLSTASTSSELLIRICRSAIDDLRTANPDTMLATSDDVLNASSNNTPVTKMDELVRSLHMLMEPIPKTVPLVIRMSSAVPPMILCDDLKLFRSALNLLSSAAGRTTQGGIHLQISPHKGNTELLFECEDTAENIPVEDYQYLFQSSGSEDGNLRICLSSVASLISSLDGEYGFRPRVELKAKETVRGWQQSGSIFWFSVPLFAPDSLRQGVRGEIDGSGRIPLTKSCIARPARLPPKSPILPRINSHQSVSSLGKGVRLSVVVGDVLQANAVANSCFRDVFETRLTPPPGSFPSIPENIVLPAPGHDQAMNGGPNAIFPRFTGPIRNAVKDRVMQCPIATTSACYSEARSNCNRTRRALVVDDSLVIRKSLAMALRKLGYEADVAVNGLEGLNQMKETEFDFVLLDFLMPVLDGLDCVKQYREWEQSNRPHSAQIIIGISAHADNDVAKQGVAAGMDDFLPKPISIKTLTDIKEREPVKKRATALDDRIGLESNGLLNPTVNEEEADDRSWRKRNSDVEDSSSDDNDSENALKRARLGDAVEQKSLSLCLMATDHPSTCSRELLMHLESNNWKVVVVHDGLDAIRMLKTRNWDMVLIDDGLTGIDCSECAGQFRAWETENRVNRQKCFFLVSSFNVPSPFDRTAVVLAPLGFDHVIRKPIEWKDLHQFLASSSRDMSIVR